MTIRHLNIFLTVCECGCNLTRAAEKLHIAQPAVSIAIRELEENYRIVLFERLGRRLQITEAGMRLKEYAQSICELYENMEDDMKSQNTTGILRVGASMTIGSVLMPYYISTFSRISPDTRTHVTVAPGDILEEKILNNELDIALCEGNVISPLIISEMYMKDYLVPVCSPDFGFENGQVLSQDEFFRQTFLLREKGSGTREVFDRCAAQAGFTILLVWEAQSTSALLKAASMGIGVAVLPLRAVSSALRKGRVISLRVEDTDFSRFFNIMYHRRKHLTSAAKKFISLCRDYEMDYPLVHSDE